MEYKKQTGTSYISFKIPKIRYKGAIKYLEISRVDGKWKANLVFDVEESKMAEVPKKENLYIDLGVKNLATIYEDGKRSVIYTGREIASKIQYKDKEIASIQKVLAMHGEKLSREKRRSTRHASQMVKHALHTMTTKIVKTAKEEGKGIVIGKLTGIRKNMCFSKGVNQQNHQWQFAEITRQLEYKCAMEGVRFRTVSEKDTSKTCVLCGRMENGRIYRGLYRCKLYNVVFNADSGAALNMKKRYLRIPLSKGSGIGVVDSLANPAVFHWNEHEWLDENPFVRETRNAVSS